MNSSDDISKTFRRITIILAMSFLILGACLIVFQFGEDDVTATTCLVDGHAPSAFYESDDQIHPNLMMSAESSGSDSFMVGEIIYKISGEDAVAVMGFAGYPASELVIPSKVTSPDGSEYAVVKIAKDAFKGMAPIESVIIPDSVVEMGKSAFNGCVALKNLTIPISVRCPHGSKNHAFKDVFLTRLVLTKGTDGLQRKDNDFWKLWKGSLEELVVNEGIGSITTSFKDWEYLKSVTLEDVESILEDQFRKCDSLVTVTAPNVRTIQDNAFMDCPRLNTVDIPSFESHTRGIFVHCPNLKTIVSDKLFIDNGQLFLLLDDGNLSLIQQLDTDVECVEVPVEVALPSSGNRIVTEIGKEAFRENENLRTIFIHDSVTMVDEHAFHDCKSLKDISMPIGIDCSYNTKKPAFKGVRPSTLVLTSKGYDTGSYKDNEFWKPWKRSLQGLTLEDGITDFETSFEGDKLTNVIALSIKTVRGDQFKDCSHLTMVCLPEAVTVGKSAFKDCNRLLSVSMPKVTDISREAFADCEALCEFDADSVQDIDEMAFAECASLNNFDFENVKRVRSKAFYDTGVEGAPEKLKNHCAKDAFGSSGTVVLKECFADVKMIVFSLLGVIGITTIANSISNTISLVKAVGNAETFDDLVPYVEDVGVSLMLSVDGVSDLVIEAQAIQTVEQSKDMNLCKTLISDMSTRQMSMACSAVGLAFVQIAYVQKMVFAATLIVSSISILAWAFHNHAIGG